MLCGKNNKETRGRTKCGIKERILSTQRCLGGYIKKRETWGTFWKNVGKMRSTYKILI